MDRVVVLADRDAVENAVATDVLSELVDRIAAQGRADIVLTGGTVGIGSLAAIARHAERDSVDWSVVRVWWGDERFVPQGSPDRNEGQATEALLNTIPLNREHVFRFPSADGMDIVEARDLFERLLHREFPEGIHFDLVLNGIGPDGHVASLFPGRSHGAPGEVVIAVVDSPKPPPQRLSLTFEALNAGRKVWIIAAGADKSEAIRSLFADARSDEIPAAGLRGLFETAVYVDEAAAALISD